MKLSFLSIPLLLIDTWFFKPLGEGKSFDIKGAYGNKFL